MRVRACAKINRSLQVIGTRADGYHELKTVFQSLALHDTLDVEPAEDGLALTCETPGIPLDQRNLVWKAAQLVWSAAGRAGEPAGRARITKRIPAQAGLGGGSADGAAALAAWNRVWGAGLAPDCLRALACRLGADVPFFLVGGTAMGVNRGDDVSPLADLPPRWVVLVFPPFGVSTPEAFRWWDEDRPGGKPLQGCDNDLEPPVARRHPELLEIKRLLAGSGAESAAMTGSGSTMFGLFEDEAAARSGAEAVGAAGWRTLVTRTATREESRVG